jgi:hypothetical protein
LKPKKSWGAHLVSGALMGSGTVLIPGGNDTLILKSMPDRFLEECISALPKESAKFFNSYSCLIDSRV